MSITKYDLVGTNTKRSRNYKSKFGGEFIPHCVVEPTGVRMNLAKRVYQLPYEGSERIATK